MGMLFNLKEWLTVADAARHLSIVFGEDVTEADVLRLVLDGHLTLSINFVNSVPARCGEISEEYGNKIKSGFKPNPHEFLFFDDTLEFVPLGDVTYLSGLFDLPMRETVKREIEARYQAATGGPPFVSRWMCDNVVVNRKKPQSDGKFFCALERRYYAGTNMKCSAVHIKANGLPDDAVIVVRTEALREFEQAINKPSEKPDKPLTTTERNTLLTIIAALCDDDGINYQERGAAARIAELTDVIGAPVSEDTVKRVLDKIPDALESRKK